MSWLTDFISGVAKPVADTIDAVHTSTEEKMTLQAKFFELQSAVYAKVMEYEQKIIEMQAQIITAEAQGENWLQRNWRPLLMLWFSGLVGIRWLGATEWFGVPLPVIPNNIEMELWSIIKIGIGGYVGGRTLEKIAPSIADAIGNMKKTS